jgi:hypothetical protein
MTQYKYNSSDLVRPTELTDREQFLLTESKTFCIYPWIHLHAYPTGEAYPCCHAEMKYPVGNCRSNTLSEIWQDKPMQKLREDMLSETPNPAWKTLWSQGLSNIHEYGCGDYSYITKEVAEQIILNRSELGDLYGSEVNEWIEFINDWAKLKGVMAIHWSWCNAGMGGKQNLNLSFDVVRYTDMFRETKSVVRDGHYGEVGYKQLADDVIKYIKNNYE